MSLSFKVSLQALLLLGILSATTTIQAQENNKARLIGAAREIMTAARYCALITVDSSGRPRARTMDPFLPGDDMVVWFGTNPKSLKVTEIRRNPRVSVYYFDANTQGYVTISGIARLVYEPKEKARRWKDDWRAFYPDHDKHYLLIAVRPERLEVVNDSKGIVGDAKTWDPPSVNFKSSLLR